jgi:SAM-dependent methyltransferase
MRVTGEHSAPHARRQRPVADRKDRETKRPRSRRAGADAPRPESPSGGAAGRAEHYSAPRLYEIAFDLNRKAEVDFLEHCFRAYSSRPVRRVLDIACGTGPHLLRLAARGYRMSGLDLSAANIEFLGRRARQAGLQTELIVGDMTDFRLPKPLDAAICMQDSQGHLLTNDQIVAHLRVVARALRPGGLYIFDRYMASSWTDPARRWSWTKRRARLTVRASFSALNDVDPVSQVFREHMELEAIENGTRRVYRQSHLSRMVFPQELRALVALAGGFEFVQWFFGFKPHQVLERSKHPLLMVVVLRKQ